MNIIHEYVYKDKESSREAIGVLAAVPTKDGKVVGIGWSMCNKAANDKFDKKRGLSIAIGRASKLSNAPIPHSLYRNYNKFVDRCGKYYKDKVIEV